MYLSFLQKYFISFLQTWFTRFPRITSTWRMAFGLAWLLFRTSSMYVIILLSILCKASEWFPSFAIMSSLLLTWRTAVLFWLKTPSICFLKWGENLMKFSVCHLYLNLIHGSKACIIRISSGIYWQFKRQKLINEQWQRD